MDAREYISSWLKASDLKEDETKAVVKDVTSDTDGDKNKLVLHLKELGDITLNATNTKAMIEAFGSETDTWKDKDVILYTVKTTNPDTKKECDGIRIKALGTAQNKKDAETFMN